MYYRYDDREICRNFGGLALVAEIGDWKTSSLGRSLRMLTIVDTLARFSPAFEPRFTFRGAHVVEVLEGVGR